MNFKPDPSKQAKEVIFSKKRHNSNHDSNDDSNVVETSAILPPTLRRSSLVSADDFATPRRAPWASPVALAFLGRGRP